jgi:hypothetical protein
VNQLLWCKINPEHSYLFSPLSLPLLFLLPFSFPQSQKILWREAPFEKASQKKGKELTVVLPLVGMAVPSFTGSTSVWVGEIVEVSETESVEVNSKRVEIKVSEIEVGVTVKILVEALELELSKEEVLAEWGSRK